MTKSLLLRGPAGALVILALVAVLVITGTGLGVMAAVIARAMFG